MKKLLRSEKGFTLAEAITVFALTAVLLAAACAVLGVFTRTFVQVRDASEARMVAGTLMETVVSELESAASLELAGDGTVWYEDYTGQKVHLLVNEGGQLVLAYPDSEESRYPDSFYNGYRIRELKITQAENRKLLEVTLSLQHGAGEEACSMTRMLECYNLQVDKPGFNSADTDPAAPVRQG